VRGVRIGCHRIIGDFQTGARWPCDCEGFRPIHGELSAASFATPDADDDDDAPLPRLRIALTTPAVRPRNRETN